MDSHTPSDLLVETHGLTKRFGVRAAIDGVDLRIPPGVAFGLLGPNGAGKTTTVEILEGYRTRTGGDVESLV